MILRVFHLLLQHMLQLHHTHLFLFQNQLQPWHSFLCFWKLPRQKRHMHFRNVIVLQADLFELIRFLKPTEKRFLSLLLKSSPFILIAFSSVYTYRQIFQIDATLVIKIICSIRYLFNILFETITKIYFRFLDNFVQLFQILLFKISVFAFNFKYHSLRNFIFNIKKDNIFIRLKSCNNVWYQIALK